MGTSTNQRSPARPNWRLPQALLGRDNTTPRDQGTEIWRAASFDPETNVVGRLSDPILANACVLASRSNSPTDALRAYDGVLNEARASGLFFDLARRALIRSVAQREGSTGFAKELFAETIAYYASRDLPSLVGRHGRISTASQLIELKQTLQHHAREVVAAQPLPKVSARSWRSFVASVVSRLTAKKD